MHRSGVLAKVHIGTEAYVGLAIDFVDEWEGLEGGDDGGGGGVAAVPEGNPVADGGGHMEIVVELFFEHGMNIQTKS